MLMLKLCHNLYAEQDSFVLIYHISMRLWYQPPKIEAVAAILHHSFCAFSSSSALHTITLMFNKLIFQNEIHWNKFRRNEKWKITTISPLVLVSLLFSIGYFSFGYVTRFHHRSYSLCKLFEKKCNALKRVER